MPLDWSLRCRACRRPAPSGSGPTQVCEHCFGPIEIALSWSDPVRREAIEAGSPSLWRYAPLLPVAGELRAGWTPLVRARRLAAAVGLDDVWLKDERANPTGSFKDRLVVVALARAASAGAEPVVACGSTGNLARAVVSAAAELRWSAVVLVPEAAEPIAGAIRVRGGYDAVNRLATEAAMAHEAWAWVNVGLRPWYVEGASTVAYETAEQLGWSAPDRVLAPIASGGSLLRLHAAFDDLFRAGLLSSPPAVRLTAAQPAGCAPVADAFAAGEARVRPVRPATAVASLAMGDPPDGDDLLAAVRSSGGAVEAVPEEEIQAGVDLLAATEAIETEPAGGVAVAALRRLAAAGVIDPAERVVLVLTAGPVARPRGQDRSGSATVTIDPTPEALAAVLPEHLRER